MKCPLCERLISSGCILYHHMIDIHKLDVIRWNMGDSMTCKLCGASFEFGEHLRGITVGAMFGHLIQHEIDGELGELIDCALILGDI